jgi:phage terminase large subunit-like protein
MPLTPEQKKIYNKEYNRKLQERKDLFASAAGKDIEEHGKRYLAEALSYEDLVKIYYGEPYKVVDEEEPEEESGKKKRKVKKPKQINPSETEIFGRVITFQEWLDFRDKARKDLFWFGTAVLGHDFLSRVHQPICDIFVSKNFDGAFSQGYKLNDVHEAIKRQQRFDDNGNPTREALILDPRGFYKSTINRVDCVQWMINVPDIRILLITGEHSLAKAMMVSIKKYLCLPKGETPTDFHLLFPEYVLTGRDSTTGTPFTVPCRKHPQVEPTFWVRPVGGNLSGWHCDIKKGDDVITDKNANTDDVRDELNKKYSGSSYIVDQWGFTDTIGTRYFGPPNPDWYGLKLKAAADSKDSAMKFSIRAAWVVKPEHIDKSLRDLTEDMVDLTFPEKVSFRELRAELLDNENLFRCQRLNEPLGSDQDSGYKVSFDEQVLQRHLYQKEAAPQNGDVFICWDWAPTATSRSDYSAGVVARVYVCPDGRYGLVILEVACDKWTQSELAVQIISLNKKWNPKKTMIEKSMGAEGLAIYLHDLAPRFGVTLDIFWRPPSTEIHAKKTRIKGLEILLKEDRLWFVSGHWVQQTFDQLTRYTGDPKNRGRHDDIPDAMSYFPITFFPLSSMTVKEAAAAKAYFEEEKVKAQIKQQYDRIFGKPPTQSLFIQPSDNGVDQGGWRPVWPTKKQ